VIRDLTHPTDDDDEVIDESAMAVRSDDPIRPGRRLRVGLVDDHSLVREGLRLVLDRHGFDIVGESADASGAFDLVARHEPDVVVMDVSLGEDDGITVIRELRGRAPALRIVVVTMHRDPETVRQALYAGAAGYVVKGARAADLIDAIEAVARGERYLHSSITSIVVGDSVRLLESGSALTAREREILVLLGSGATTSTIARRLGISPHTVRRHIANLSDKLGARGTPALVRYAVREGLVREPPG
jgi:DNA-binding NarL/FixJ family response regulator